MKNFPAGKVCKTPAAARAMYRRDFEPLEWSKALHDKVVEQYRTLRYGNRKDYAGWKFDEAPDDVWNDAVEFTTKPLNFGRTKREPRQGYQGNCNAFAPKLSDWLEDAGIDPDCLRLVTCEIVTKATGHRQGHMVLAVLTDEGALICDSLRGCWMLLSPEWDNSATCYDWHCMEGPGNSGWVDIRERMVSLEDVTEAIG